MQEARDRAPPRGVSRRALLQGLAALAASGWMPPALAQGSATRTERGALRGAVDDAHRVRVQGPRARGRDAEGADGRGRRRRAREDRDARRGHGAGPARRRIAHRGRRAAGAGGARRAVLRRREHARGTRRAHVRAGARVAGGAVDQAQRGLRRDDQLLGEGPAGHERHPHRGRRDRRIRRGRRDDRPCARACRREGADPRGGAARRPREGGDPVPQLADQGRQFAVPRRSEGSAARSRGHRRLLRAGGSRDVQRTAGARRRRHDVALGRAHAALSAERLQAQVEVRRRRRLADLVRRPRALVRGSRTPDRRLRSARLRLGLAALDTVSDAADRAVVPRHGDRRGLRQGRADARHVSARAQLRRLRRPAAVLRQRVVRADLPDRREVRRRPCTSRRRKPRARASSRSRSRTRSSSAPTARSPRSASSGPTAPCTRRAARSSSSPRTRSRPRSCC